MKKDTALTIKEISIKIPWTTGYFAFSSMYKIAEKNIVKLLYGCVFLWCPKYISNEFAKDICWGNVSTFYYVSEHHWIKRGHISSAFVIMSKSTNYHENYHQNHMSYKKMMWNCCVLFSEQLRALMLWLSKKRNCCRFNCATFRLPWARLPHCLSNEFGSKKGRNS